MGLTMSDDGGLELFVEFFVAAASLALTSSSFAVVSSSLRVVWSSCLTTASNFRSNSLKRCSHRSQSGHPFPVLMDDDSTRNRRILEHRFQAVNSYDSFVKCGLISLDRQAVVRTFVDDLLGDFSLATHRVDGHQTAGNIDDFKQFRDCRDFVALLVNDRLPKADVVCRCPCADHVNRRLAAGVVVASAKCLAVNCDDLSIGNPVQFSEPSQQNWFELFRLNRVENGIETIMRRNALGHVQELGKPLLLCVCKPCDCNKIIRSRDDSADHHEQHIDQRINRFAATRIGDVSKLINKRSRTVHRNMPWRNVSPSRCDSAAQTRNFTQCPRLPRMAQSPCRSPPTKNACGLSYNRWLVKIVTAFDCRSTTANSQLG